ncbi:hypothetical protein GCM10010219_10170 [Streptomyces netropsis]|nr:hypothetical protein GCM10010219_10170 [Streptomyces netropsis]
MKAVLSGETVTFAVPAGHPDPLTATTSITTLSGGGTPSAAAALGAIGAASSIRAAPPVITGLNMKIPLQQPWRPPVRTPVTCLRITRGPAVRPDQGHSFQAKW